MLRNRFYSFDRLILQEQAVGKFRRPQDFILV